MLYYFSKIDVLLLPTFQYFINQLVLSFLRDMLVAKLWLEESCNFPANFVGVCLVIVEANDESRICRFFNMRGGCWKGDNCPNEHTRYSGW